MTPPFCSFSFRLHGFCIPCGQPCAEMFELLEFNGNLAKTQKVLCEVFRSILSNSEGTSAAYRNLCVSNERFRSIEY